MNGPKRPDGPSPTVRCAIYTRKSVEEGLQQEFNSLHAQREVAEAYVASQRHEGWICLPEQYDDGGYTGANMQRPALRRLFADIEAGAVDCVVIYKVDRLSRSLLDFARMMEIFDRHRVSFVSVTQQFNTATSMGRLILNVLLSFAQFEREMIAERTRDKIAATRRRGRCSCMPRLGYDVVAGKQVVNAEEAQRVRAIFELYLQRKSLTRTARELAERGWVGKRWTTRQGRHHAGEPFGKNRLKRLLKNVIYVGKVRYKEEVHPGDHQAIVDIAVFQEVQRLLAVKGTVAPRRRQRHGLLQELLRCGSCDSPMAYYRGTKGRRGYPYYRCRPDAELPPCACADPRLPAGEIEPFVVNQIERLWDTPRLAQKTNRLLPAETSEIGQQTAGNGHLASSTGLSMNASRIRRGWETFRAHWESLSQQEQSQLLNQLIERIVYSPSPQAVSITYRCQAVVALAELLAQKQEKPRESNVHD